MSVLHQRHRVGVGLEADLGQRLVVEPVDLQHLSGEQFRRVALRLGDHRLAFHVGERVDVRVGGDHDLEVLRVQVGELADVGGLLRIGRIAGQAVDGRARVAEADLRLALVDAADVGDAGAGDRLDLQAGDLLFPHALERAAERNPRAALGAGHEGHLLCRHRQSEGRGHGRGAHSAYESHLVSFGRGRSRLPPECASEFRVSAGINHPPAGRRGRR